MKTIFLFILFLASACSSLSDSQKKPTNTVIAAREQFQKGIRNATTDQHEQAIKHFQTAYGIYTGVDEIKGKIRSSLALGRQYLILKKPQEAEPWIKNAETLISLYQPGFKPALLLLHIEQLFIAGRSDSVLKLTEAEFEAPAEIAGQIWAYRLLSKDRLRLEFDDELDELENSVEDMTDLKEDGELNDQFAYSYCIYLTGWAYYANSNFKKALQYYEMAYREDQELENMKGISDDVLAIAQTKEKQGKTQEALAGYFRALEMYRQAGRTADSEDAEFRLLRLKLPEGSARSQLNDLMNTTQSDVLKLEIRNLLEKPDSLFLPNRSQN